MFLARERRRRSECISPADIGTACVCRGDNDFCNARRADEHIYLAISGNTASSKLALPNRSNTKQKTRGGMSFARCCFIMNSQDLGGPYEESS